MHLRFEEGYGLCENPLKRLALMGAIEGPVRVSSSELGLALGVSSQTASRRLQSLEQEGLIKRSLVPDGQLVTITDMGTRALLREFDEYKRIFSEEPHITIKGRVIRGMGEGQYYMSLEGYRSQFQKMLGFTPYPGTLNLKLEPSGVAGRRRIEERGGLRIEGFSSEERTFGGGMCFPIHINGMKGGIIIPDRSHYPDDIAEIVAPVCLRDRLRLRDGDEVSVEVE